MEALKQAIKAVGNAINAVSAIDRYGKTETQVNRLITVKADLDGELAKRDALSYAPKNRKKQPEE